MQLKEKDIELQILQYLAAVGVKAWKNENQGTWDPKKKIFRRKTGKLSRYKPRGISDIIGHLPGGKALYIEVKKPLIKDDRGKVVCRKTYPSKEQSEFLHEARSYGCIAIVARSVDDVITEFKKHDVLPYQDDYPPGVH